MRKFESLTRESFIDFSIETFILHTLLWESWRRSPTTVSPNSSDREFDIVCLDESGELLILSVILLNQYMSDRLEANRLQSAFMDILKCL